MPSIQTVLKVGGVNKKELKKLDRSLSYVLEKYKVWKDLKEREKSGV